MQTEKIRKKRFGHKRTWTAEDWTVLKEMFADNYTADVCEVLGISYSSVSTRANLMGLKKSEAFMAMEMERQKQRLLVVGEGNRFTSGQTSHNKGKKMPKELFDRLRPTMFQKGHNPHNTLADWTEVLRTDKLRNKCWMIKIPNQAKLMPKHKWLWEKENGKVEKGWNVIFKDGDQLNCVIENLACLSDAELMQRNSYHRFPTELKNTIRLLNKLKKRINEKQD
jgi:hypothetical protein